MNEQNVYVNGNPAAKMNGYFYDYYELDPEETLKQGRKMYRDVPFVLLVSKGGKRKVPMKATQDHIEAYPEQWKKYNDPEYQGQTHLSLLGLKPSKVKDLEHFGIKSLEDLVNMDCPECYQDFKVAAQLIINLREYDYEQSKNKPLQSCGQKDNKRGSLRAERIQKKQSSAGACQRSPEKERSQERSPKKVGLYNFNFGTISL